jgi:TolA-binding protein
MSHSVRRRMMNNGQQMFSQLSKDIENRNIKIMQLEAEIQKLREQSELAVQEQEEIDQILEDLSEGMKDE